MKKHKKIFLITGSVLAAVVVAALVLAFYQYPYYLWNKEAVSVSVSGTESEVKVMSFNIRLFTPTDTRKKHWYYRADLVVDCIEEQAPGVIGFQEVTPTQYKYLCDTLSGYDSIMTYRDESPNPEGCPVFYLEELYTLVDKGSFWLSETPEVMSKDWGAACYRICSYVILKEKKTEKEFVVFNTHLDHVSDEARIKGIQVVLDKIAEFGGLPAVLMGDLNAKESSKTYKSATENFMDTKYLTENTMTSCTYQNWGTELDRDCIDYILVSKTGFSVKSYRVVTDTYDGVYSSDHFPLVAELMLE